MIPIDSLLEKLSPSQRSALGYCALYRTGIPETLHVNEIDQAVSDEGACQRLEEYGLLDRLKEHYYSSADVRSLILDHLEATKVDTAPMHTIIAETWLALMRLRPKNSTSRRNAAAEAVHHFSEAGKTEESAALSILLDPNPSVRIRNLIDAVQSEDKKAKTLIPILEEMAGDVYLVSYDEAIDLMNSINRLRGRLHREEKCELIEGHAVAVGHAEVLKYISRIHAVVEGWRFEGRLALRRGSLIASFNQRKPSSASCVCICSTEPETFDD